VSLREETTNISRQGRVQFAPIHDHPLLGLVLSLVQGERRAHHVAGQLLAPFAVTGLDAHLVIQGEAAVPPAQQLGYRILVDPQFLAHTGRSGTGNQAEQELGPKAGVIDQEFLPDGRYEIYFGGTDIFLRVGPS
jgi:hypothetical protein